MHDVDYKMNVESRPIHIKNMDNAAVRARTRAARQKRAGLQQASVGCLCTYIIAMFRMVSELNMKSNT